MQNKDLKSDDRRSFLRDGIWIGAITFAYFLAHQIAFLFPDSAKVLMAVWPAAGIGLTALLLCPRYLWPAILVAIFVAGNAANLIAGRPFVNSIGFMTANVLESLACAWFMTRWCGKTITFTRKKEILALVCAATIVNACTAAIGACVAFITTGASFWGFWETWWVADALGILLVVPFIVVWGTAVKYYTNVRWSRVFESGLFFAIWIIALWLSVHTKYTFHMLSPQPYLFFTLLAWCAFRFGQLGVSNALAVLAFCVISSKTAFTGGVINQYDSLLLKQLYLGCIGITGYLLAASNIEQKLVAKELTASMIFLNTIIDKNPFSMWLSDRNGTLFQINKACCELMDVTENEVVGKYNIFDDTIIKEQGMIDKVRSVYEKGEIVRFDLVYDSSKLKNIPLDKTVSRIIDVTIFPIMDANGKVVNAVIQHIDITDRKQAEMALLESEKRLNEAQKLAHIGVWDWKADTDTVIWTEELYHIAGLNPMLPAPTYKEQSNLYTSKSWELLKNGVERAIATGEPYQIELELTRPDGSIRCVNAFGGVKYDDKGQVYGLFGTVQDITETKKVEDALFESEERYRNFFEKSRDALMTLEPPSWSFTSGNTVALELFGAKSVQEFIAQRPVDLSPERQPDSRDSAQKVQEMIETALHQGSHFFEWTHKRINGEEFFANVLLTRVEVKGKQVLQATVRDITDRVLAQELLKTSEEKFSKAFKASPEAVSISTIADGKCIEVNDVFLIKTGYTKEEVIGHSPAELNLWVDMEERRKFIENLSMNGFSRNFEAQFRMHSGEIRDFIISSEIIDLNKTRCNLSFFFDITDRKLAEQQLNDSQKRLALAASSAQLGIWDWDITNNKMFWDDQMFRLYGIVDKPDTYGIELWRNGLHPDDGNTAWDAIQAALRGEQKYSVEFRAKHTDGSVRFIKANGLVLRDGNGQPVRMIGINHDITDRKMAEQEHLKLELQIQQTQKLESLGVLAGGIAHDFNNLMGGIFGYIDMASEASTENKVTGYLSKAMNTIGRARALTQQLLTFAKGGAPVQQTGDLFPFVQETAQFALSGANVSCHFDVPKNLWACNFDKNQIGQVIDNLIINAQQSMPAGGTIELTARNVTLAENEHPLLANGNYIKISVKDSGIGIPKELISRIFDPFFTTKVKGHGLGLATCYSIIKRHEGCIEVESEPGKGSAFKVYLPATTESASSAIKKTEKPHNGSGTFLIMDDEEVMRDTIGDMLETLGYMVVSKEDGRAAVDFFMSEIKEKRKIIGMIFDLTVPGGMGGKAAMEEIRKLNNDVPAFVASGYADDPVMKNPAEHGFLASICKPFRKSELSEMLKKYMNEKKKNGVST